ncbi:hypothetical protein HPB49_025559 [Dermacentor silvarum]|uniref:Uncharacterized protein n=1 Tax=Dermacentor silvarum TaxID=543639 RepID=A0ACB8DLA5_DERSI|nr:hypothetical protein HPB49_025559 [Dermacentor silvarum]
MAPCSWSPVPTFGVQVSVCGLEFSAFYGPACPGCAAADVSGKTCGVSSACGLPEWLGGGTGHRSRVEQRRPLPSLEASAAGRGRVVACLLLQRPRCVHPLIAKGSTKKLSGRG